MRIRYVKLLCDQVDSTFQAQENKIRSNTLCILNRTNDLRYINRNLDVNLRIREVPEFTFRVVDQDDNEVRLGTFIVEFQLTHAAFFREG